MRHGKVRTENLSVACRAECQGNQGDESGACPTVYLGKRAGFSLIELMVVVGIIMLLGTIGIASYINFQDRTRVSSTAKSFLVYLRQIQGFARNGDRGPQISANEFCYDGGNLATRKLIHLNHWNVELKDEGAQGYVHCSKSNNTAAGTVACQGDPNATTTVCADKCKYSSYSNCGYSPEKNIFELPKSRGTTLLVTLAANVVDESYFTSGSIGPDEVTRIFFEPIYGQATLNENMQKSGSPTSARFVFTDGTFSYIFHLRNGAFTPGCTCQNKDCDHPLEREC